MRTTKTAKRTEKSWISRHIGSVVFLSLVFSSVVYAISWPTVPGEAGYPLQGGFWNYFEKILVDTGATTDGTVKKAETIGKNGGRTAVIADANGNIGVGTGAETGYAMSISGQAIFSDTVTGTPPTASGHLTTKGYVDGIVSAAGGGGGGYNQCYRVRNGTAAYPTCAAGYSRVYGAYLNAGPNGNNSAGTLNFENNAGGFWFSQYGHVYMYYVNNGTYYQIFDDQDVQLTSLAVGQCNIGAGSPSLAAVFSQNSSTYQTYNATGPANFTCSWWSPGEFGYAVCCK